MKNPTSQTDGNLIIDLEAARSQRFRALRELTAIAEHQSLARSNEPTVDLVELGDRARALADRIATIREQVRAMSR